MHWKAFEKIVLFVVIFGAVTVLAVSVGHITATLWFSSEMPEVTIVPALKKTPVAVLETPSENLFGQSELDAPVRETTLKLTLLGVMPSESREQGMAVIRDASGLESVFVVGESPAVGVVLNAVYKDHVVLSRAGMLETLFFSQSSDEELSRLFLPSNETSKNNETTSLKSAPSSQSDSLQRYERMLQEQPKQAFTEAGLEPKDGALELKSNSPLKQFGLQTGDRILSINGVSVLDLEASSQLMSQFKSSGSIQAEIERGGQRLSINISLP